MNIRKSMSTKADISIQGMKIINNAHITRRH